MNTNSAMPGITRTLVRRAYQLQRALSSYPTTAEHGAMAEKVALIVTCEEYAALRTDPELWTSFSIRIDEYATGELRLCGILVLPR